MRRQLFAGVELLDELFHRDASGAVMRKQPAPELLRDGQAGDSAASGIR